MCVCINVYIYIYMYVYAYCVYIYMPTEEDPKPKVARVPWSTDPNLIKRPDRSRGEAGVSGFGRG